MKDATMARLSLIDFDEYARLDDLETCKEECIDLVTNYWDFKSKKEETLAAIERHTSVRKLSAHMWNAAMKGLREKIKYS